MSGGSYDYLSGKLRDGELDAFSRWASQLDEDLAETAQKLRLGLVEVYENGRRPYPAPAVAATAVDEARQECADMAAEVARLREKLQRIADVAHACEWSRSGDTGADHVADACLAFVGLTRPGARR
jgi:hypothetical protein